MTMPTSHTHIVPVTIRAERYFDHPPEAAFDSYADIERRSQWIVPPGDTISFQSHDFGAGGLDHYRQGHRDNSTIRGTTRYEHIVPNDCIVFTERLLSSDDQLLVVALVSWSIAPSGSGTTLTITDQSTSVVGSRPIEGARHGYELLFDRLAYHLDNHMDHSVV